MARQNRSKSNSPRNNVVESVGPCRPDDYYANNNRIPANVEHLYAANAKAQLAHKDMHQAMKHGAYPEYRPEVHQIMERFKDQNARRGVSTFHKACDEIVGG